MRHKILETALFLAGAVMSLLAVAVVAQLWLTFPPADLAAVSKDYWETTPVPGTWYGQVIVWCMYYMGLMGAGWPLMFVPLTGGLITWLALKTYAVEESQGTLEHLHTLEQTVNSTRHQQDFLSARWDMLTDNLDKLFEQSGELWLVANPEGRIRRANKAALQFFRQAQSQLDTLEGRSLAELWRGFAGTPLAAAVTECVRQGKVWHGEIHQEGQGPHLLGWVWPLGDDTAVLLRDVSVGDQSAETLRNAGALASDVVEESGPACIAVMDTQWRYLHVSRHWHKLFALNPDMPLAGQSHSRVIPSFPANLAAVTQSLAQGNPMGHAEEKVVINGREEFLHWSARPWHDADNRVAGLVLTVMPVTELVRLRTQARQTEERENALAYADTLTGLPNRQLFSDRLTMAIAVAYRQLSKVALMFIDLDGFKAVNDTLGHEYGDMLLKQVAQRLNQATRETDTVARLGGDEFTIILSLRDKTDAELVAKKLLETLSTPFDLAGKAAKIGGSIGIAMYPQDGTTGPDLIKRADEAMYEAKKSGKNTYRFATKEIIIQQ